MDGGDIQSILNDIFVFVVVCSFNFRATIFGTRKDLILS